MKPSFRLGRIAGVEIGIHYTWLFAFALIAWSLAEGFFPGYFPGWSIGAYWLTGAVAAVFLFLSVLVHELAHSFVAKAKGLPVQGITLFIFGGVSNIGGEAAKAKDEFVIAIVGPLTSLVLSGLSWVLYRVLPGQDGPLVAILSYLSLINLMLAGFNLLPGFPLDGGRVLRSILWGTTGSLTKATRIAASVGQAFGWLLIAWGVYQVLGGQLLERAVDCLYRMVLEQRRRLQSQGGNVAGAVPRGAGRPGDGAEHGNSHSPNHGGRAGPRLVS